MQQTQFRQVNKELQDTMAQLEVIRHEIRSISIMNPGPLTRRLMDNPDQDNPESGFTPSTGLTNISEESTAAGDSKIQLVQSQEKLCGFKTETSVFKGHGLVASGTSNLYSHATAYTKLAESPALKYGTMQGSVSMDTEDRPGLLQVLPVSAESVVLVPNRQGEVTGSEIVLESEVEAEVARNAKEFFSEPQNQIKVE